MSFEQIITSFTLGLIATGSPCIIPLYPGFLAYLSSNQTLGGKRTHYFLGFFVLLGVLTMMLTLGGIIAALSVSIGSALRIIIPLADAIIIGLGALLIGDINPMKTLPQIKVPALSHPFSNAFVYGLLYGPISLPCSGPLLVSIFAVSLTAEEAFSKLAIFLWFGLGFGMPLLVLSFLAGATQRWITRQFALHSRKINMAGGLLLIGVGIYDLIQNWELLFG